MGARPYLTLYLGRTPIGRGWARNLGLGTWPHVSLTEAREKCVLNLAARRRGDLVLAGRKRTVPTFGEAVDRVIAIHAAGWRDSGRSERQWRASLRDYAMWRLRGMPVNRIGTADVMAVLLPIWAEKRETARRVRQRISAVMRWAVAQGYREDNPAGDAIGAALPKTGVRTRHQPALPYTEVRGAMERVRASKAYPSTVLAFEFLVLTACRSGEVRGARWEEMDIEAREWRIPPERMKTNREHRVPLSTGALAVLREARSGVDGSDLVFPSVRGRALSDATISKNGPRARDWGGSPRVPVELPGLGGGMFRSPARGVRTRAGPCDSTRQSPTRMRNVSPSPLRRTALTGGSSMVRLILPSTRRRVGASSRLRSRSARVVNRSVGLKGPAPAPLPPGCVSAPPRNPLAPP